MLNPSSQPLPVYGRIPEYSLFAFDMAGRFLYGHGPAVEHSGYAEEEWPTLTIFDLYEDNPELIGPYTALLGGRAVQAMVTYGGRPWFIDARPVFENGVQVRVVGLAVLLEPEDMIAPAPKPAVQLTEAAGDEKAYGVETADRFFRQRGVAGVMQVRMMADAVYAEYERATRARGRPVHIIRPFPPTRASLSLVP